MRLEGTAGAEEDRRPAVRGELVLRPVDQLSQVAVEDPREDGIPRQHRGSRAPLDLGPGGKKSRASSSCTASRVPRGRR